MERLCSNGIGGMWVRNSVIALERSGAVECGRAGEGRGW